MKRSSYILLLLGVCPPFSRMCYVWGSGLRDRGNRRNPNPKRWNRPEQDRSPGASSDGRREAEGLAGRPLQLGISFPRMGSM